MQIDTNWVRDGKMRRYKAGKKKRKKIVLYRSITLCLKQVIKSGEKIKIVKASL